MHTVLILFMDMKKKVMLLTEPLFFDTDCLSAFLWVNDQSLLAQLYPGRIIIPAEVYKELSNPRVTHLRNRIDILIADGSAKVEDIDIGSREYTIYLKMISDPDPGHSIIGKGEAAAISMAKERCGIVASNNLRDVKDYVSEFDLNLMTTGDILKEALGKGLITESDGNQIWQEMLGKRRKLGYTSFTEYLNDIDM